MSSFSVGYAGFIWSSGNSICAYCWPTFALRFDLAPDPNYSGTEALLARFLGRTSLRNILR
jgi:hypothetical protein